MTPRRHCSSLKIGLIVSFGELICDDMGGNIDWNFWKSGINLASMEDDSARKLYVSEINSIQIRSGVPHRGERHGGWSNFRTGARSGSPSDYKRGIAKSYFPCSEKTLTRAGIYVRIFCSVITMLSQFEPNETEFRGRFLFLDRFFKGIFIEARKTRAKWTNMSADINEKIIKHRRLFFHELIPMNNNNSMNNSLYSYL